MGSLDTELCLFPEDKPGPVIVGILEVLLLLLLLPLVAPALKSLLLTLLGCPASLTPIDLLIILGDRIFTEIKGNQFFSQFEEFRLIIVAAFY